MRYEDLMSQTPRRYLRSKLCLQFTRWACLLVELHMNAGLIAPHHMHSTSRNSTLINVSSPIADCAMLSVYSCPTR